MLAARRARDAADAGFTMLELVVVMSIMGVLMTIGMFGFSSWQATAEHQGTADGLVGELRNVATRAVSEGRTYCVEIQSDDKTWSLWRYSCGGTPAAGDPAPVEVSTDGSTQAPHVSLAASTTAVAGTYCAAGVQCLYFFPRGTATPAEIDVTSTKRPSKIYTINVQGLTSRVFI